MSKNTLCENLFKFLLSKLITSNVGDVYEVEVNRDRNLVSIHYKWYSEKFDEWRPILLRLRPVELMSLITGAVIYTKGYSGTDGDHTRTLTDVGSENLYILIAFSF